MADLGDAQSSSPPHFDRRQSSMKGVTRSPKTAAACPQALHHPAA
jgi:hypothetical protein